MRLPPDDPDQRDREESLPLADVLGTLRAHGVSVDVEPPEHDGTVGCILVSDEVAVTQFMTDPVGGLMIAYLARTFGIERYAFYRLRKFADVIPIRH